MDRICIYPDGTWCFYDEINEYYWKSDDYKVFLLPLDLEDEEEIELFVFNTYMKG